MRVLMIAPINPASTGNGLAMRAALFVEAFESFANLDLIVVPIAGDVAGAEPKANTRLTILPFEVETHFKLLSQLTSNDARLSAFIKYGKPSLSACLAPKTLEQIRHIATERSYKLIHVMRSYMMPVVDVLPENVKLSVDLDEDDFLSTSSRSKALCKTNPSYSRWLAQEANAFDSLIGRYHRYFSRVFISARRDGASLSYRHEGLKTTFSPNAIAKPLNYKRHDDGRTIAFIGSFGYAPNVDGLIWFVEKVMPRFLAQSPKGFTLLIAGRDAPPLVQNLAKHPRVRFLGAIAHVEELYRQATIAIAPLRTGGGSKTKIIEAAMHGVACVSHQACKDTLMAGPHPTGWLATTAEDFAKACIEAMHNKKERKKRENAAWRIANRTYEKRKAVTALARSLNAFATDG